MNKDNNKEKESMIPLSTADDESSFEKFFIKDQNLNDNSIEMIPKIQNNFNLDLNEDSNLFLSQDFSILLNKKELYKVNKEDSNLIDINVIAEIKTDNENIKVIEACCQKCLKMFSTNKKACMCQVPRANIRNENVKIHGCRICGCKGCLPRDRINERKLEQKSLRCLGNRKNINSEKKKNDNKENRDPLKTKNLEINEFNKLREEFINDFLKKNLPDPLFQMSLIPKRTASYILGNESEKEKDN